MIVIDASAVVAIMTAEEDHQSLSRLISRYPSGKGDRIMSSISIWESAVAVARLHQSSRMHALQEVEDFMRLTYVEPSAPNEEITRLAVDASERYGFGNAQGYPGILNIGDCFSYATARYFSAKLVCKGEDFKRTDIELA